MSLWSLKNLSLKFILLFFAILCAKLFTNKLFYRAVHYSSVSCRYTVTSCRSDFSSTTNRRPTRSRWSVIVSMLLLSLLSRRRCSGCSFHSALPLFWRSSSWGCWWTRGCSCWSGGRWWGKKTGCCKDPSSNWVLDDWGPHFRDSWEKKQNKYR